MNTENRKKYLRGRIGDLEMEVNTVQRIIHMVIKDREDLKDQRDTYQTELDGL